MFRRLRLAVVYGGDKSRDGAVIETTTNPRSWKSYEAVAKDIAAAMQRLGCRNIELFPDDMRLGERLKSYDAHLAWLNTGGVQGHCSVAHAPAMLELFGIPYIGHDPMTAAILDNKHVFKRQLKAAGIPTAEFFIWQPGVSEKNPTDDAGFRHAFAGYEGPFIVKPASGRASLHVTYVEGRSGITSAVEQVYAQTRNHVVVERFLGGREFCVAVAGPVIQRGGRLERLSAPLVFSVLERTLEPGEVIFTSMDVKPITGERAHVLDPAAEPVLYRSLETLARRVFRELGVETLIRADIRADEAGNLYVLEANPKPDLKMPAPDVTSLVCIGLPRLGMTYDDLIMSVFADRIDVLLSERRGVADRLARLI
ncbi:MAG: D-alanine--D-alanine ligase family protein [Beijerinckiaceae bacterium]